MVEINDGNLSEDSNDDIENKANQETFSINEPGPDSNVYDDPNKPQV